MEKLVIDLDGRPRVFVARDTDAATLTRKINEELARIAERGGFVTDVRFSPQIHMDNNSNALFMTAVIAYTGA